MTASTRPAGWFSLGGVATLLAVLIVTQAWRVDAAPGDTDATFSPMPPCRLFDFRPGAAPEGAKKSPLGPGEENIHTQQVTGDVGDCSIPAGAVAVSMNVTIAAPTEQSNLRIFPADAETPMSSNLNWVGGQAPTPNKVDVMLSPDGQINLFNQNGTVNVLADVVGFYTDATLKELADSTGAVDAYTRVEADERFLDTSQELVVTAYGSMVDSGSLTAEVGGCVGMNGVERTKLYLDLPLPGDATITDIKVKTVDTSPAEITGYLGFTDFPVTGSTAPWDYASSQFVAPANVATRSMTLNSEASTPASASRSYFLEVVSTASTVGFAWFCGAVVSYNIVGA